MVHFNALKLDKLTSLPRQLLIAVDKERETEKKNLESSVSI